VVSLFVQKLASRQRNEFFCPLSAVFTRVAGAQLRRRYSEEIMAKNLSNLRAPKNANTGRKRVGRGMGSGMGKTSTRGHKGQRSRSGSHMMRGFEGGQMPLHRRLPKRGFTNIFRTEYTVVNLDRIAELGVTEIGQDDYKKLGLASNKKALIKILGSGELTSAVTIYAHKFSKSATEKIEKAGGKVVVLGGEAPPAPKGKLVAKEPKSLVGKGSK
jgi:large subunit ribosomal protein L15